MWSNGMQSLQELKYKTWLLCSLNFILYVHTYISSFVAASWQAQFIRARAGWFSMAILEEVMYYGKLTSHMVAIFSTLFMWNTVVWLNFWFKAFWFKAFLYNKSEGDLSEIQGTELPKATSTVTACTEKCRLLNLMHAPFLYTFRCSMKVAPTTRMSSM